MSDPGPRTFSDSGSWPGSRAARSGAAPRRRWNAALVAGVIRGTSDRGARHVPARKSSGRERKTWFKRVSAWSAPSGFAIGPGDVRVWTMAYRSPSVARLDSRLGPDPTTLSQTLARPGEQGCCRPDAEPRRTGQRLMGRPTRQRPGGDRWAQGTVGVDRDPSAYRRGTHAAQTLMPTSRIDIRSDLRGSQAIGKR
jgi:hypothetical protein